MAAGGDKHGGPVTPAAIMDLGSAFMGSKVLLSAVELGVFTELAAAGPLDGGALRERLGLHPRGARDFFDALVALGMLERDDGTYSNTPAADLFLDRSKPSYVGRLLEMRNERLFGFWDSLTEALRTGEPHAEAEAGEDFFDALYSDPDRLRVFARAMSSASARPAQALAGAFPWDRFQTVIDVGCAEGCVPVQIARANPHISGGGFDLPQLGPIFDEYVRAAGLEDRLQFHPGDFFNDELPRADVLIMGRVLHDWGMEEKRVLLEKAYRALPDGGALIVYEALIDDDRRENALGLLMSLNMLITTEAGFDYTGADCERWMRDAGFGKTYVKPLVWPDSIVVGHK